MVTDTLVPGQWRLARIEIYNWGTFSKFHRIDVPRRGLLLTGKSGSGKSSLVDAISAVLTPPISTRFNAAAADGGPRTDDRTLHSYVRGAWRRTASEDTGEIASEYLRPGATWSGILLRYDNRLGNQVNLIRLVHAKTSDTRSSDLATVMVIAPHAVELLDFKPFVTQGIEISRIKRAFPDASVDKNHSAFLNKAMRLLGIASVNAIVLLHRTQAAKNLGSLDDLFRNFMLDPPQTFELAERASAQFEDLREAHAAVVTAREQIEALQPIRAANTDFEAAGADIARLTHLDGYLHPFAQNWRLELARAEAERRRIDLDSAADSERQAAQANSEAGTLVDRARAAVMAAGGAELAQLSTEVDHAVRYLADVTAWRDREAAQLQEAGLAMPETAAQLAELVRAAQTEQAGTSAAKAEYDEALLAHVTDLARLRASIVRLTREITALTRSGTNMGADLIDARDLICQATGLRSTDLPFAGQLIAVRSDYAPWTGAIERVLRPLATVMLVSERHVQAVRAAADGANLGTRLRFEAVPEGVAYPFFPAAADSVPGRVDLADHPFSGWLRQRIAERFGYVCVDSERALLDHEHAVTIRGLVKRAARSYEKDDRHRVDDERFWLLGFSNDAKIEQHTAERAELERQLQRTEAAKKRLDASHDQAQGRLRALQSIAGLEWERIDVAGAERAVQAARQRRHTILAARGDLRQAEHILTEALQQQTLAAETHNTAVQHRADLQAAYAQVARVIEELEQDPTVAVPTEVAAALEEEFTSQRTGRSVTFDKVSDLETLVQRSFNQRLNQAQEARRQAAAKVERAAAAVHRRWPAVAPDLTESVEDRAGYLELLARLEHDGLPQHEDKFFDMLTTQSRQNIGVLATTIRSALREVRGRIEPINRSLLRSEFDKNRYLQIKVISSRPPAAEELLKELEQITSGLLGDADVRDRAEQEERFNRLHRIMDAIRPGVAGPDALWRTQALDTRKHVRFVAHEQTSSGERLNTYDSGAGLSGGQKQKLVVFCLAAALRYQLSPSGQDIPPYGTVVMDEAFDKADASFTAMAMDIFEEFGFHMVLATPVKLVRTLEPYLGGICAVTCADSRVSQVAPVASIRDAADAIPAALFALGDDPQ